MTKATAKKSYMGLLTPLDDRVLIQQEGQSDRTPGGIIIPDTVKEKPSRGKIVAIGRGHMSEKGRIRPMDVNVGDVVVYNQWSGQPVNLEGEDLIILREEDILGTEEE